MKNLLVSLVVLSCVACDPTPKILESDLLTDSYLEYAISRTGQFDLECKNVIVIRLPTNSWGVMGCGKQIRYYIDVDKPINLNLCTAIGRVTSHWFDNHCYLVPYVIVLKF